MKDIVVERFKKNLNCGATVEGFREIIYEDIDESIFEESIFEEEN